MTKHPSDSELVGLLAGELSATDEVHVKEHVNGCPTCRAELRSLTDTDSLLRKHIVVRISDDFAARVVARAKTASGGITRRVVMVAACALLTLGIVGGWVARATLHAAPRPLVRDADGSRFMLMFIENLHAKENATPEERDRANAEFGAWFRTLGAGTEVLGGTQLVANDERIYGVRGVDSVTVPGPTNEQMTGFIVVRANQDDVAEFARRCPIIRFGGRVIVRQLRQDR